MENETDEVYKEIDRQFLIEKATPDSMKFLFKTILSQIISNYEKSKFSMVLREENEHEKL